MENTRLTPQEHKELSDLQRNETELLYQLGMVEFQHKEMEEQLEQLIKQKNDIIDQIRVSSRQSADFMLKIRNKYGEVKLNTATGEIIKEN